MTSARVSENEPTPASCLEYWVPSLYRILLLASPQSPFSVDVINGSPLIWQHNRKKRVKLRPLPASAWKKLADFEKGWGILLEGIIGLELCLFRGREKHFCLPDGDITRPLRVPYLSTNQFAWRGKFCWKMVEKRWKFVEKFIKKRWKCVEKFIKKGENLLKNL